MVGVGVTVRVGPEVAVVVRVGVMVGVPVLVGVFVGKEVLVLVGAVRLMEALTGHRPSNINARLKVPSSPRLEGTPSKSTRQTALDPEPNHKGTPGEALVGGVLSFPV